MTVSPKEDAGSAPRGRLVGSRATGGGRGRRRRRAGGRRSTRRAHGARRRGDVGGAPPGRDVATISSTAARRHRTILTTPASVAATVRGPIGVSSTAHATSTSPSASARASACHEVGHRAGQGADPAANRAQPGPDVVDRGHAVTSVASSSRRRCGPPARSGGPRPRCTRRPPPPPRTDGPAGSAAPRPCAAWVGAAHGCQEVGITVEPDLVGHDDLGQVGHRHCGPTGPAGVVDHLAVGDREQPAPQVVGVAQVGVGPQRRDHRLLEAVGPVVGADRRRQEAVEVGGVLVEQRLEGWQRHREGQRRPRGLVRSAANAGSDVAPSAAWWACPSG